MILFSRYHFFFSVFFFFFNDTATTEIYTLSLHDALPISRAVVHDDDVQLAAFHRALEMRGVGRDRLARGGAREEPEQHGEVLEARDDLLDAHAGDVERSEEHTSELQSR